MFWACALALVASDKGSRPIRVYLTVAVLRDGRLRNTQIARVVQGISPKILAQTHVPQIEAARARNAKST